MPFDIPDENMQHSMKATPYAEMDNPEVDCDCDHYHIGS